MQNSLKTHVQQLLADAGLPNSVIIQDAVHPEHFGDSEVAFKVGPMHLLFVRERGRDFVELGPATAPNEYYQFGDVELAMGWKSVDEVWSKSEPEPLAAIVERLRTHLPEFTEAFSTPRLSETLSKLKFASRRRGGAFVDHLRRIAENARRK